MAKISFAKATEPTAAAATEIEAEILSDKQEVSSAITPKTESALSVKPPAGDDFSGEVTRNDVRLPRLYLVGRTSDLANSFSPGSFVISKEVAISDGKTPLTVIATRVKKQYQENIEWDDPDRNDKMRVYDTLADVKANGGTLTWEKGEGNFSEIAHIELLVEKPEGISDEADAQFFVNGDGKAFAHVVWTVSSSGYSAVAKPLISARVSGHLKENGFIGGKWHLTSVLVSKGKLSWWAPVLRTAGVTTEQFRKDLETL